MVKVLVIEDDLLMLRLYERMLQLHNFEVVTAERGKEGIQKALEVKPQIILLDIMMPEMNGLEVLDQLKQNPLLTHIPVVILTNLTGQEDREEAMKKGAAMYVVKSEHEPQEITMIIAEVLKDTTKTP